MLFGYICWSKKECVILIQMISIKGGTVHLQNVYILTPIIYFYIEEMKLMANAVPIWQKAAWILEEVMSYTSIGVNKLRKQYRILQSCM